ncbi:Kelch-type beta propeller [Arabidopsis suecica]|uniref:Kelch-type beta propeller n=1 Tax=Arabidopsis suecica TaxID=45249 RepID=A0A8T1ZG54_ARASU|nr:Kelch-type beta propeller [Arabidopsis suecica]
MVAYGSQLFMFEGYSGENVLNDLFSWKLEVISGKWPHARFSHSLFVVKHIIGIIGGCPVSQNRQELTLLDLKYRLWSMRLEFINKRVVCSKLACYDFGKKFSEPVKSCSPPT